MDKLHLPISLRKTFKTEQSLSKVLSCFEGQVFDTPAKVRSLVKALQSTALHRTTYEVIQQSILDLTWDKAPLTQDRITLTALRLAGGLHHLSAGKVVAEWTHQPIVEYVAAQITNMRRAHNRKKMLGWQVEVEILQGYASAARSNLWWSDRMCKFLAKSVFGFSKFKTRSRPYSHPLQLVRLFFVVQVLEDDDEQYPAPRIGKIGNVPSLQTLNKKRIDARKAKNSRLAIIPCPIQLPKPCTLCPVGYKTVDPSLITCSLATREYTQVIKQCARCNKETLIDPSYKIGLCHECLMARSLQRS